VETYFNYNSEANKRGVILIIPVGRVDNATTPEGKPDPHAYWNTGPNNCCHATSLPSDIDDDGQYLLSLLDEAVSRFSVDEGRVYFSGHSNGSFMSLFMACRHSDRVAAISGNAGALPANECECRPSSQVSVLHFHAKEDATILYSGGNINGTKIDYTGAEETVSRWARYNKCSGATTTGAAVEWTVIPYDTAVPTTFSDCPAGTDVHLVTVQHGAHVMVLPFNFPSQVFDFLLSHKKGAGGTALPQCAANKVLLAAM
jgi:poly(3-hydroxybutyrate) depolymerase